MANEEKKDKPEDIIKMVEGMLDNTDFQKTFNASLEAAKGWMTRYKAYKQAGWNDTQAWKLVMIEATEFFKSIFGGR